MERRLVGKSITMNFLITAGGTREYIDPVRFISNAGSGKMGYAVARAAIGAGHAVTLITAPTGLRLPKKARVIKVQTSAEMFAAVKKNFAKCDCLIMTAAVCDYAPVKTATNKIKKRAAALTIELKLTADILKWAGTHKKKKQLVVGFALEDKALRKNAQKKLSEKKLDMIIANSPAAIGAEKSTVHIKTSDGPWSVLPNTSKRTSAKKIIAIVSSLAGLKR